MSQMNTQTKAPSVATSPTTAKAAEDPELQKLLTMSRNEMGLGPKELEKLLSADLVVKRCAPRVLEAMGVLERGLALGHAIMDIRDLITADILDMFMRLQNSQLGFLTDIKGNGYDKETVKTCIAEALLYGVMPVGNEFNIITGKTYITKNGFIRLLKEYPGLTDLRINMGVPIMSGKTEEESRGAIIPCTASWVINGIKDSLECNIPTRLNKGMGADGLLGKAERKLRARVYGRLTGSTFTPEGELDDDEVQASKPALPSSIASIAMQMKKEAETIKEKAEPRSEPTKTEPKPAEPDAPKAKEEPKEEPKAEPKPSTPEEAAAFTKSLETPGAATVGTEPRKGRTRVTTNPTFMDDDEQTGGK